MVYKFNTKGAVTVENPILASYLLYFMSVQVQAFDDNLFVKIMLEKFNSRYSVQGSIWVQTSSILGVPYIYFQIQILDLILVCMTMMF